jgi:uncharacterized membrane protein HdeD (DUF308 family)
MKDPILLFLALMLAEIARHLYIIHVLKRSPNKAFSLTLRIIVGVCFLIYEWFNTEKNYLVVFLAYVFMADWLHDTIIALSMRRKPWYKNQTGYFDKIESGYGPYLWILETILAFGATAMYFFNE